MINWKELQAPVPADEIRWRADGKPKNGRVRAVAYTDAEFVRQRLDAACGPGGWRLELGPVERNTIGTRVNNTTGEEKRVRMYFVTCTLALLDDNGWVMRADIGQGKDPKEASSDAFKRAAHRFGVAAELWRYPKTWADCDQYGNLTSTPSVNGGVASAASPRASTQMNGSAAQVTARQQAAPARSPAPPCPRCNGPMWDNRGNKRNPAAPDFKCKNRECVDEKGFVTGTWEEDNRPPRQAVARRAAVSNDYEEFPDALRDDEEDGLPF